jgi:hypothetical protein
MTDGRAVDPPRGRSPAGEAARATPRAVACAPEQGSERPGVGAGSRPRTRLGCRRIDLQATGSVRSADRVSAAVAPGERLEPSTKPLDVGAAAGEELAAEADVETGPAHDVGHESVARDEVAARQSNCKGAHVEPVACAAPALGEVTLEHRLEAPLAVTLDGATLVREREAAGELTQQREQR